MQFPPAGPKASISKFPQRAAFPFDAVIVTHLSPGETHTWHFLGKKHSFRMTGHKLLILLQWRACAMLLLCPGGNFMLSLSTELPRVVHTLAAFPNTSLLPGLSEDLGHTALWGQQLSQCVYFSGTLCSWKKLPLASSCSTSCFYWTVYLPARIRDAVRLPPAQSFVFAILGKW